MPYIKSDRRDVLRETLRPQNAGELNYIFHLIVLGYLRDIGEKYQTYNDIMGALEGTKLELYRRRVGAYEDTKLKENGDVTV